MNPIFVNHDHSKQFRNCLRITNIVVCHFFCLSIPFVLTVRENVVDNSFDVKGLGGNLRPSSASSTLSSRHLLGSLLGGVNNKVVYIIVLHLSIKLHYISIHHVIILLPHLTIFLPYIKRQLGQYFTNKQINIIKSNIKKIYLLKIK